MTRAALLATAFAVSAVPALAQDVNRPDAWDYARESRICEDQNRILVDAYYNQVGELVVQCRRGAVARDEDPTAFVPLLGGLAPLLGIGAAAAVLGAAGGSSSTSGTF